MGEPNFQHPFDAPGQVWHPYDAPPPGPGLGFGINPADYESMIGGQQRYYEDVQAAELLQQRMAASAFMASRGNLTWRDVQEDYERRLAGMELSDALAMGLPIELYMRPDFVPHLRGLIDLGAANNFCGADTLQVFPAEKVTPALKNTASKGTCFNIEITKTGETTYEGRVFDASPPGERVIDKETEKVQELRGYPILHGEDYPRLDVPEGTTWMYDGSRNGWSVYVCSDSTIRYGFRPVANQAHTLVVPAQLPERPWARTSYPTHEGYIRSAAGETSFYSRSARTKTIEDNFMDAVQRIVEEKGEELVVPEGCLPNTLVAVRERIAYQEAVAAADKQRREAEAAPAQNQADYEERLRDRPLELAFYDGVPADLYFRPKDAACIRKFLEEARGKGFPGSDPLLLFDPRSVIAPPQDITLPISRSTKRPNYENPGFRIDLVGVGRVDTSGTQLTATHFTPTVYDLSPSRRPATHSDYQNISKPEGLRGYLLIQGEAARSQILRDPHVPGQALKVTWPNETFNDTRSWSIYLCTDGLLRCGIRQAPGEPVTVMPAAIPAEPLYLASPDLRATAIRMALGLKPAAPNQGTIGDRLLRYAKTFLEGVQYTQFLESTTPVIEAGRRSLHARTAATANSLGYDVERRQRIQEKEAYERARRLVTHINFQQAHRYSKEQLDDMIDALERHIATTQTQTHLALHIDRISMSRPAITGYPLDVLKAFAVTKGTLAATTGRSTYDLTRPTVELLKVVKRHAQDSQFFAEFIRSRRAEESQGRLTRNIGDLRYLFVNRSKLAYDSFKRRQAIGPLLEAVQVLSPQELDELIAYYASVEKRAALQALYVPGKK